LHVTQIFKQPMPDGRLATVVRCTEESSMRMDPREVAAQLDRLCGALASGALSLDGLGAPLKYLILNLGSFWEEQHDQFKEQRSDRLLPAGDSFALMSLRCVRVAAGHCADTSWFRAGAADDDSLPPLPACLVGDDAGGRPERATATTATAAGSSSSQRSPQLEVHECRDGQCRCVRKRLLHLQRSRSSGSRRASEASRREAALPQRVSKAAGVGTSVAQAAADDEDLVMHQSVSASGVMSVTLRPPQPKAVEDPERRLLANQAFLKAKAARERPDEAASSSSEDEASLIRSLLHKAVADGRVQLGQAEAAAAVLAGGDGGADEPQPAAQGGAAEPAQLRKHEAVRRISVDFLDRGGYFDRPIQVRSGCSYECCC
jgi:hypothetical protein